MSRVGFDPTTDDHATAEYTPGQVYDYGEKSYKYCYNANAGAVAAAAGDCAVLANANGYDAITPGNGTALTNNPILGAWAGPVTAGNYGWVLCSGTQTGVKCAATTAIGDSLVPDVVSAQFTPLTATTPTAAEVLAAGFNGGQVQALTAYAGGTCTARFQGLR